MKKLDRKSQSGFTIIEVMIVLAIAGLIMLIVFMAVPALQRNSRNTQRKSEISRIAGIVNEYASNHAGALPSAIYNGTGTVPTGSYMDLSGEKFSIMSAPTTADIEANATSDGTTTVMKIHTSATCDPTANTLSAGSARSFSITYQVETSGNPQNACIGG